MKLMLLLFSLDIWLGRLIQLLLELAAVLAAALASSKASLVFVEMPAADFGNLDLQTQ